MRRRIGRHEKQKRISPPPLITAAHASDGAMSRRESADATRTDKTARWRSRRTSGGPSPSRASGICRRRATHDTWRARRELGEFGGLTLPRSPSFDGRLEHRLRSAG